jgi:phosphatidylglycerol:prolipoprotein diacylglycerol transferase
LFHLFIWQLYVEAARALGCGFVRVCSKLVSFPFHMTMFASGAIFVQGFLHVGRLRFSVYGTCAAVGLIAALWLSQRTAKLAGLVAEKVWDAGVLGICAAFVVSRLLLIVRDPGAFIKYPVLVLALPSLTYGGMALTVLIVWGYLRWKRLPLRDVLDAWAPCGALLGALLSLGHLLEGTDVGMPTRLPWGVLIPGDAAYGRVQPVQIYAMVAALVLLGALLWMLRTRTRRGAVGGVVAGVALVAGGAISFSLDMMTQPMESMNGAWVGSLLEPGQWLALMAMLVGVWLWATAKCVRVEERVEEMRERI